MAEKPQPARLSLSAMSAWVTSSNALTDQKISARPSGADIAFMMCTRLVERISAGLTVRPSDIIAIGTPNGVGIGFDPPRFLKSGDTVTVEIKRWC